MASWFSVVARVLRTDRIANSTLQSARCEFEEGDIGTRPGTGMLRNIDVSYFGDRFQSGRSYVIYGGIRLPPNDNYIDLLPCFAGRKEIGFHSVAYTSLSSAT